MWNEIERPLYICLFPLYLKTQSATCPISVGIRSDGGCWYDCRMYDKVDVLVMGFRDMNRLMYGNDENQWDKG